jgi:UDP-N-acetylglucosamine 2-epimerase (non-hydrolysing)
MKVMTLFGTRPEIIRLCRVVRALDAACSQVLVHTGQNYDPSLSDIFFDELGMRAPDVHLGVRASNFASQVAQILERSAAALQEHKPDRLLILGDTNSALAAIVAARMGVPVYHMEAGNRCYDDRVPEEINRRVVDHSSTILLPYTERSKDNLLREGIPRERIFVTGNPIFEVLEAHRDAIANSTVLDRLAVEPDKFFLITIHRAENVDAGPRLERLLQGLSKVADDFKLPMVVSLHPRTRERLREFGLEPDSSRIRLMPPLGFFDFVRLEQSARCVLSDSGTVQEECCIFHVPSVTLRDVTERPETVECGSNIVAGSDPEAVLRSVQIALALPRDWVPPREYCVRDVSRTVVKILLGHELEIERRRMLREVAVFD